MLFKRFLFLNTILNAILEVQAAMKMSVVVVWVVVAVWSFRTFSAFLLNLLAASSDYLWRQYILLKRW
jgi:hypothetical protein